MITLRDETVNYIANDKLLYTDAHNGVHVVKRIHEYEYIEKLSCSQFSLKEKKMFDCIEDEDGFLIQSIDFNVHTFVANIKKRKEERIELKITIC